MSQEVRAVVARDRYCVKRGCGRKPGWCDVHHITPVVHDGPTCLSNLALVCRDHHHAIHDADDLEVHPPGVEPTVQPVEGPLQRDPPAHRPLHELARLEADPKPLEVPLVILDAWIIGRTRRCERRGLRAVAPLRADRAGSGP